MEAFDTLTAAMGHLRQKGYLLDFNIKSNYLNCMMTGQQLSAKQFHVDYIFRFEGENDPSDSSILYGISTVNGNKGLLVEAYGAYVITDDEELIRKLNIDSKTKYE